MEAAPPSYEKATLIDPWDIIARYIPSNDLCSAALVCSRWHTTFTPHLWGNPASHFGIENDHVYVALTKFKRTLQTARLLVRSQTHTLHLPPAHAELYNGPHATWLRDILQRLPNLQSLIVRGLPFFDYSALQALKYKQPTLSLDNASSSAVELPGSEGIIFQRPVDFVPSFGLRLLDASKCSNITATSLARALRRFEALIYLDLSYTYPARDPSVLEALKRLTGIQVVKLRGIGLHDDLLQVLASSIGRRVRSLDVRNNSLSDRGIRTLLEECFTTGAEIENAFNNGQRSPTLLSHLGHEMLDIYQGEDFEGFIRNTFTSRFMGRMAIEDASEGGITHLYISGSQISVEGISGLVRSRRLHVLDVESVSNALASPLRKASIEGAYADLEVPGVEKLTPIMASFASETMKFLRIDHALLSKDNPEISAEELIPGLSELDDNAMPELPDVADAVEVDATPVQQEAFELPAVQTPKYELPGDPLRVVVSPAVNGAQNGVMDDPPINGPRRGSAFAPEVVVGTWSPSVAPNAIRSPVSAMDETGTFGGYFGTTPISPEVPQSSLLPDPNVTRPATRPRTYSSVAIERRSRLQAHTTSKHNLHPAMLPNLVTLILTDVPPFSPTKEVSDRLICFIRQCAEEAHLARQQARLDYSLPPGRRGHATALKHSEEKIFALKRIVLELGTDRSSQNGRRASQWQHGSTKSVTEDHDSESLWSAAETDFSFFGDEEEIYPSLDSGRYAHMLAMNGKEISFRNGSVASQSPSQTTQPISPKFDNIALLSAFRKERKLVHTRSVAAGAADPDTEGFWPGIIQIVRPDQLNAKTDGSLGDYHSTRFDNGRLYN